MQLHDLGQDAESDLLGGLRPDVKPGGILDPRQGIRRDASGREGFTNLVETLPAGHDAEVTGLQPLRDRGGRLVPLTHGGDDNEHAGGARRRPPKLGRLRVGEDPIRLREGGRVGQRIGHIHSVPHRLAQAGEGLGRRRDAEDDQPRGR